MIAAGPDPLPTGMSADSQGQLDSDPTARTRQ